MQEQMRDMDVEDRSSGPIPLEKLEGAGINASDIKKLQEGGYYTVESVGAICGFESRSL